MYIFEFWFAFVLISIYYPISLDRTIDERTSIGLPDFNRWLIPAHVD